MPGFNGTGPRGEGPMTGGGRGNCNPGYAGRRPSGVYGVGRGGMPWGGGRGCAWGGGRGRGRGMGRGWGFAAPQPGAKDERAYLADQLSALENEMHEIKERVKELDKDEESK